MEIKPENCGTKEPYKQFDEWTNVESTFATAAF